MTAEFVIGSYHQLFQIEAHLTIVFAALAVIQRIEDVTGWSIRKIEESNKAKVTESFNHSSRQFSSWIHWHEKSALCRWKSKVETHPDLTYRVA